MSEAVIVALIAGGLAFAGTVVSNVFTHSKTILRLDILERKVEAHNHLVERMYIAEGSIRVLEEKQKDIDGDIGELKQKAGV